MNARSTGMADVRRANVGRMRVARNGGVTSTYKLDKVTGTANVGYTMGPYSGTINCSKGQAADYTSHSLHSDYGMKDTTKAPTPTLFQLAKNSAELTQECLVIAARIRESLFSDAEASMGESGEAPYGLQNGMHRTLSDLEKLRDDLYRIESRIVLEKSK
jgi:hypothetical protein